MPPCRTLPLPSLVAVILALVAAVASAPARASFARERPDVQLSGTPFSPVPEAATCTCRALDRHKGAS